MTAFVLEQKPGAPKGTFKMIGTLLNGFVPGWNYERPRFLFSCEPELAKKIEKALAPLGPWTIGPYEQGKPPMAEPLPFQRPGTAAAPAAEYDEDTEMPTDPSGGAPSTGTKTPDPAWANQLKSMLATAGPPPPSPVPMGQPVQAAAPGDAVPPPAPTGSSGLASHMTSQNIPTKLPAGPSQVTMPPGHQPAGRPPEAVEPQFNGQPATSDDAMGPSTASGGMLRGFITDDDAMGNMRPFDYAKISSMRSLRNKDGRHMIRVGPMSERVYCLRFVKDGGLQHGSTWLVEKKYADHGGERILDKKKTWPEAIDVVLGFEMALADHLAGVKPPAAAPQPPRRAAAPQPAPVQAPPAPVFQPAPAPAASAAPDPDRVALDGVPLPNGNGVHHEETPPVPGVSALGPPSARGDSA